MDFFIRFELGSIFGLMKNHFGSWNLELVTFPAHGFDQYCQVQFPSPGNQESIRSFRLGHSQRYIGAKFIEKALAQFTWCAPLAFPTWERWSIHAERHPDSRFLNANRRQGHWVFWVGQCLANGNPFQPRQSDDLTSFGMFHFHLVQALVDI